MTPSADLRRHCQCLTLGDVTPELDVRLGCISKLQCERHVLPPGVAFRWLTLKISATSFLKSLDGVLHEACRTGQRPPCACLAFIEPADQQRLLDFRAPAFGL